MERSGDTETKKLINKQRIDAGLDEDIERIIYKVFDEFEKQAGPRFTIYTEIWHETGLGRIFNGRDSFREMFQFTEEVFLHVQRFCLSTLDGKPNHILVRYAAIYMLYSLFYKQPCRPRVMIRLLKEELDDMLETIMIARQENHWDVVYAWSKLFTGHSFHYVATQGQMGMEVAMQMEEEQKEVIEKKKATVKENYFKSKEFLGLMKNMEKAHSQYVSMKTNLVSKTKLGDSELFMSDQNFPQTVMQLSQQVKKDKKVKPVKVEGSAIGNKRRDLKYKYFGQ